MLVQLSSILYLENVLLQVIVNAHDYKAFETKQKNNGLNILRSIISKNKILQEPSKNTTKFRNV